jgi:hypothetical protein
VDCETEKQIIEMWRTNNLISEIEGTTFLYRKWRSSKNTGRFTKDYLKME